MEYRFVNHTLFAENGIRDLKLGGYWEKLSFILSERKGKSSKVSSTCILAYKSMRL